MIVTGLKRYTSEPGAAFYRRKYERSIARRISNRLELRTVRRALAAAGPAETILDIPCGAGRLVPTLLTHARRVVCADISAPMLRQASDALAPVRESGRLAFTKASVFHLPFPQKAFDAAVCWRLTHHLPDETDRRRLFAELARVSRRFVVVSFSDGENPKGIRRAKSRKRAGRQTKHVTLTQAQVIAEAKTAGLELAGIFPLSRWFSVVTAALFVVR